MELGLVLNSLCYEFFRRKFLWSQLAELAVEVFKVKSQHTSSIPGIHVPLAFGMLGLFSTVTDLLLCAGATCCGLPVGRGTEEGLPGRIPFNRWGPMEVFLGKGRRILRRNGSR